MILRRPTKSTSALFRAVSPGPVSGQLVDATAGGSSLLASISCHLSMNRLSLLGLSCSRQGVHLPCGWITRHLSCRDPDGVSVFRVVEKRPGWVPSIRRGRGVHTAGPRSPAAPCRFPAASPIRRTRYPSPTVCVTTHTKIHLRLPVRSSPARNSRMDRESLGISVGFTPPGYPDRMPRRGERLDTRPITTSTPPILHPSQSLEPRDFTSHS